MYTAIVLIVLVGGQVFGQFTSEPMATMDECVAELPKGKELASHVAHIHGITDDKIKEIRGDCKKVDGKPSPKEQEI